MSNKKIEYHSIINGIDFYMENGLIQSVDFQQEGEYPLIEIDFSELIEMAIKLAPDQMKEYLSELETDEPHQIDTRKA